jgi:hypothetical protein
MGGVVRAKCRGFLASAAQLVFCRPRSDTQKAPFRPARAVYPRRWVGTTGLPRDRAARAPLARAARVRWGWGPRPGRKATPPAWGKWGVHLLCRQRRSALSHAWSGCPAGWLLPRHTRPRLAGLTGALHPRAPLDAAERSSNVRAEPGRSELVSTAVSRRADVPRAGLDRPVVTHSGHAGEKTVSGLALRFVGCFEEHRQRSVWCRSARYAHA